MARKQKRKRPPALTADAINAEPMPDKPKELRDGSTRGLVLRIQPGTNLRTWYFEYRLKGKKSRVKLGQFPSMPVSKAQNEAVKKRNELLENKDPGAKTKAARQGMTLRAFVETHYRPWVEAHRKTGRLTANRIEHAFASLLDRRISGLTQGDFTAWRTRRKAQGAAAKTCNSDIRVLRAALQWGVDNDGIIKTNTAAGIKREREKERPALRALTDDEERDVLAVLPEHDPFRALVIISLDTGARRAEALTLDWAEVNLKAGTILLLDGKTKSGKRRLLPLTPRAKAALKALQAQDGATGRVWSLKPGEVFRRWKAACEAAGIVNRPRWHDLRATFATRLVRANVSMPVIMSALGHSSLAITEGYLRMDSGDLTDAIAALAARNEGTK
jgi:integrase